MKTAAKIVNLAAFKKAGGFSEVLENGQKIPSENVSPESGSAPENKGLPASSISPLHQGSEEHTGKPFQKQKATKAKAKAKKGKAAPASETPGPLGHVHDADTLDATTLRLRYWLTYSSWKNRKYECAKKGGKWLYPTDFAGFLKEAGPRLYQHMSLDRLDNANPDYGPGLSEWRDHTAQNNNKGDTIVILDPVTGEKWTSHKLAKKHKVKLATIHKWRALGYTDLELIAGKKDPTLAGVGALLKKHVSAPVPKASKPKVNTTPMSPPKELRKKIAWPANVKRPDPFVDNPHSDDPNDPLQKDYDQRVKDCRVLSEWIADWNHGYPCPAYPPEVKSFPISIDVGKHVLPAPAVTAKLTSPSSASPANAVPAAHVAPHDAVVMQDFENEDGWEGDLIDD